MRLSKSVFLLITMILILAVFGCGSLQTIKEIEEGDFSSVRESYLNARDEEEQEAIKQALRKELEATVDLYNNVFTSWGMVSDRLDEIEKTGILPSYEIDNVRAELYSLSDSKDAYQTANEYMDNGNYLAAMEFYQRVISYDSNYKEAQKQYQNARNLYKGQAIKQAEEYALSLDYDTAISILYVCDYNMKGDAEIETLIAKYETDQNNHKISKLIEQADKYMEQSEFSKAYQLLLNAVEEYPSSIEIATAFSKCEQAYIAYALANAQTVFSAEGDYDKAISILSLALIDLPDNAQIQAAIANYTSYRPIELKSVPVFYEEDGGIDYDDQIEITDNVGKEYFGYYYVYGSIGSNVYRINGEYTTLRGVAFVPMKYKDREDIGRIIIYGDGRKLFDSGKMGKGVIPVIIDINIKNVIELKIENTGYVYLADVWLQKDINS